MSIAEYVLLSMTGPPGLSGTEWPVLVPLFVRTEGVLDDALG